MRHLEFQGRITVRSPQQTTGTPTPTTQSASGWVDVAAFQDLVAWTNVTHWDPGGGTAILLQFQTSPSLDEQLFTTIATLTLNSVGVSVTPMLAGQLTVPLQRWFRWVLVTSALPSTGPWSVSFVCPLVANPRRRAGGGSIAMPSAYPGSSP